MTWFKQVKVIVDKTGATIFKRFAIFQGKSCALYVHRLYREDKDPFPHNHPWSYVSIILWGGYTEFLVIDPGEANSKFLLKERRMFDVVVGNRRCFHKIHQLHKTPTITLFFTFGTWLQWYYLNKEGLLISNKEFRNSKENGAIIQTTKQ